MFWHVFGSPPKTTINHPSVPKRFPMAMPRISPPWRLWATSGGCDRWKCSECSDFSLKKTKHSLVFFSIRDDVFVYSYSMLFSYSFRSPFHCMSLSSTLRIYFLHRSSLPQHGRQVAMIVIIEGVPWLHGFKSTEAPIIKSTASRNTMVSYRLIGDFINYTYLEPFVGYLWVFNIRLDSLNYDRLDGNDILSSPQKNFGYHLTDENHQQCVPGYPLDRYPMVPSTGRPIFPNKKCHNFDGFSQYNMFPKIPNIVSQH